MMKDIYREWNLLWRGTRHGNSIRKHKPKGVRALFESDERDDGWEEGRTSLLKLQTKPESGGEDGLGGNLASRRIVMGK